MRRGWRLMMPALLAGIAMVAGLACDRSASNQAGETTLQRIERTGTVRIAYANEAPFGYNDPATGKVTGEAPEIAGELLKRMGVKHVESTLTDFGQLIPGLKAGRFDIIAAGMYVTPERARQINFSLPTYVVGEGFVVKKGNPKGLHSFRDVMNHADAVLGVVGGTAELSIAEALKIPEDRTMVFPDNGAALAGLLAGRIDAFAGTALTVQDLLRRSNSNELERADPFEQPSVGGHTKSYGAFGFRKEDTALLVEFNKHLETFIGSPEHRALVSPFGFTEAELPDGMTVERIIGSEVNE